MRKITPKNLLTLRDGFAIIKDNKIIANQNIFNQDGELLTPQGYPIPKFSTSTPYVGDARFISSSDVNIIGSLILDNGRTAEFNRALSDFGSTTASTKSYARENLSFHLIAGIDGLFPAAYQQKKGEKAGRFIARHPSGYIDITSDVKPEVLERYGVLKPASYGASVPSGSPHAYPGRIIDETEGSFVHITQGIGWSSVAPYSASNSNNYPIQETSKNFDYTYAVKDYSKWQRCGIMPVAYDKERKTLIALQSTNTSSAYGTTGAYIAPLAFKLNDATTDYDVFASTYSTIMDSYVGSTSTPLNSNTNSGYRVFPICRAVTTDETQARLYLPRLLSSIRTGEENLIDSGFINLYEYVFSSGMWTRTNVTLIDESTGFPIVWGESQFSLTNGTFNNYRIAENEVIVHLDLSFVHEIDGETYITVMRVGTGTALRAAPSNCANTIQYTFRLDSTDKTKAYLVSRDQQEGFFGLPNEALGSFAGNKDYSHLYVIGMAGIYRLKFDQTLLRYVMDDVMINVPATSLAVTDDEDLWILDSYNKLYNLRVSNSDIVRVAFAENTNMEFAEAPYDIEVRVSTVNHLGQRASRSVELVVEGNAAFKANNRNKITVTTSSTDDITVIVTVKDYGQIYVTPTSVS